MTATRRHARSFVAIAAVIVLTIPSRAAAASTAAPSLAERAARFSKVVTATADFVQEREVSLVDDVLHSSGSLALAAPASFRLDLTAPDAMTLIATGATMTIIDAHGKAMPVPAEFSGLAAFARTLTDLLLGARPPQGFTERWRDPDTVVLTPAADGASPFTELTLHFLPSGPLPESIVMRERGGDRTTIHLVHVVQNTPLDPAHFVAPDPKGSATP
jgi:outer membrane lipoprotein-sorting protein